MFRLSCEFLKMNCVRDKIWLVQLVTLISLWFWFLNMHYIVNSHRLTANKQLLNEKKEKNILQFHFFFFHFQIELSSVVETECWMSFQQLNRFFSSSLLFCFSLFSSFAMAAFFLHSSLAMMKIEHEKVGKAMKIDWKTRKENCSQNGFFLFRSIQLCVFIDRKRPEANHQSLSIKMVPISLANVQHPNVQCTKWYLKVLPGKRKISSRI